MTNEINEATCISNWKPGQYVSHYVYLSSPRLIGEGKGKRYVAKASDASGAIDVVDFNSVLRGVDVAGFYLVHGNVNEYQGAVQLEPTICRSVIPSDREAGFREEDCVLSAPESTVLLAEELDNYVSFLIDPAAVTCWTSIRSTYRDRFDVWPAAKSAHHAYCGGLLYHTVSMLRIARSLAQSGAVGDVDWDVLFLGIHLHDIGKVYELGPMPGDEYTLRGVAEGHISMSAETWANIGRAVWGKGHECNIPLYTHVRHLILSHHGARENGSPVLPLTPEAHLLHLIDMMDSRLEMIRQATKGKEPGEVVDCWPLGKVIGKWEE